MDLFVVPLAAFRAAADAFQPTPNHPFAERAQWLLAAYRCFTDPNAGPPPSRESTAKHRRHDVDRRDPRRDRDGRDTRRGGAREPDRWRPLHGLSPPAVKPQIGPVNPSEEQKVRKEFLGILNKMSAANATALIAKCSDQLRPEFAETYLELFWAAFLRSADYQPFQVQLLRTFDAAFPVLPALQARVEAYAAGHDWWPTVTLPDDAAEYDEFCDYVKWKKRMINTIHAWDRLAAEGWSLTPSLADLLAEMLADFRKAAASEPVVAKVLETIVEQMLVAVRLLKPRGAIPPAVAADLLSVAATAATFPPAVRFKWYDLQEVLQPRAAPTAPNGSRERWKNDVT